MDASGLPSEQAGALPNLMNPTGPPRAASDDPGDAENVPLPPLAEILDDTDHFRTFNNTRGMSASGATTNAPMLQNF